MSVFAYKNRKLCAEGAEVSSLAQKFGTPLYVYSRRAIEKNYQAFDRAFENHPHLVCYAVKANANLAVLNVLARLGAGFDIVSVGELLRVQKAGGDAARCVFSGVGKSAEEIHEALAAGIFCFNVESKPELLRIQKIAAKMQKRTVVSIRVNPDIDAGTHPHISTGLSQSKFGVNLEDARALCRLADGLKNISLQGLSCHIGSQLLDVAPFLAALEKILMLAENLAAADIPIRHLNLGGGVGIAYQNEPTIDIEKYIRTICYRARDYKIILEPGRAIVGDAGIFVTRVEYLKHGGEKSFAIVNGAMNDFLRPALYDAFHQILLLEKNESGAAKIFDVVGPVCESADYLAKDRRLHLAEGDYLALLDAGAYGFVMSSNYNSRPRAAEVMVDGKNCQLVGKREHIRDLFAAENRMDDVDKKA